MGLFSKSSTSTTQNVTNNDNRQALSDSVGISGDGSSITMNSTNYMLDGGAIEAGRQVTIGAINATRDATVSAMNGLIAGNKNALDYGVRITDNAFAAIGQDRDATNKLVSDAMRIMSDNSSVAQRNTAEAWKQSKDAANGTSMGDYKIIFLAIAGVFGLWMLKRG